MAELHHEHDDHEQESNKESLLNKISEKIHAHDSSSSDSEKENTTYDSIKSKIIQLFGSGRPVHKVFGGGKPADIFLWRDKKLSRGVLGGATIIWILFELLGYHFLTLISYIFMAALVLVFFVVSCFFNPRRFFSLPIF